MAKKRKDFTFKMEIDTNNGIVTNAYFSKQIDKKTELMGPFTRKNMPFHEGSSTRDNGINADQYFIDEAKNMPSDDNFISYLKEAFPTPNDFYRQICNVPDLNYSKTIDNNDNS